MARALIPTPLVTVKTIGDARPVGAPLMELWALFLRFVATAVSAGELSESRMRALKTTARRCTGLPAHPEPGHIKEWYGNMQGKPSTRRGEFWNLHSLYAWAHAANFAGYNPCHRLKLPKTPPPKRHAIRDVYEKWPAFLATADRIGTVARERCLDGDRERGRALLGVLRFAGLRIGEALGLKAADVDTWCEPWVIHVRRQRSEFTLTTSDRLKTPSSYRPVDVHPELRALLAPVLAMPPASAWSGKGGSEVVPTELLFGFTGGRLRHMMAALREVSAVDFPPDDAWHVWRHTIAVELRRRGREVDVISKFLGHESIQYTQTYLRGMLEENQAAGIFEGITGPPPWAAATQSTMPLGVLGAVKKGGSPPSTGGAVEARRPEPRDNATPARRRGSNPSESVSRTEQTPTPYKRKNAL